MKKNFKFLNTKGFTLAEIMVATGMLAVISLGVMQLMSNMTRGQKEFEQNAEIRGIMNYIGEALQDTNTCNYSLVVNKYVAGGGFYDISDINAADINNYTPSVIVERIMNPHTEFFSPAADEAPFATLQAGDDIAVASACDENYAGGVTSADLKTYGCLIGNDKGRILIRRMWLGLDEGNTALFITFVSGGLINVFTDAPATNLKDYYQNLRNTDPEAASKLSGSFGAPIVTRSIRINLSSVTVDQVNPINQLPSIARITDPAGNVAEGDVTSCFTSLTDTIQAACENFGGQYHDTDSSCRALRIRSDNSSNIGEAGIGTFPQIPTNAVSPGGVRSTAIATEGHVYVGPLNNTAGADAAGGNLWVSGTGIFGARTIGVNPAANGDDQGKVFAQSDIMIGSKATGAAGDSGSFYADGGLVLGTANQTPADNSGHIYSNGGIALGTTSGAPLAAPNITTSGGLAIGAAPDLNLNPGNGNAMIAGGVKIGALSSGAAMPVGDLAVTSGISVGQLSGGPYNAAPLDGTVHAEGSYYAGNSFYGLGSLHLGTHAPTASAGSGHIRISGVLNVGSDQIKTAPAGSAHIKDIAFSYGLPVNSQEPKALATIEWVKTRVAQTLAPTGSAANAIATDILQNAIKDASSGIVAIQKDACENFMVRNNTQALVGGTWNSATKKCTFSNTAKDCSIDGQCVNVYANNAVISDKYMRATTYVRADTYLQSGQHTVVGSYLTVGTNATFGGNVTANGYVYGKAALISDNYVRGSRFCIGGTGGTACITKVRSNVCANNYKVVSWMNGHVTCIPEGRWY